MNVAEKIGSYYGGVLGEHSRERSWEHCYSHFRTARPAGLTAERDYAALQLAFYLASWGMYRGSSFLLQHAYTVHRGVVDLIAEPRFDALWGAEFGAGEADLDFMPVIFELIGGIKRAYEPFAPGGGSTQPTDTLITKIILRDFRMPAGVRWLLRRGIQERGAQVLHVERELHRARLRLLSSQPVGSPE